ncbi:MAG: TnpV protein [Lachnospiraceae bacterium]|nr:TnpV protein [Lachnospiraceae bacterium]
MMKSLFEEMGGTYVLGEDGMYYPELFLPTEEAAHYGKYGMLRKAYLKEWRSSLYITLMQEGKLNEHLNEVDDTAHEQLERIMRRMMDNQGVDEAFKARDQLGWVGTVNNIRNAAEEIIFSTLIYA